MDRWLSSSTREVGTPSPVTPRRKNLIGTWFKTGNTLRSFLLEQRAPIQMQGKVPLARPSVPTPEPEASAEASQPCESWTEDNEARDHDRAQEAETQSSQNQQKESQALPNCDLQQCSRHTAICTEHSTDHNNSGTEILLDMDATSVSELESVCGPKVVLSSAQHMSLSQRDLFASERQYSSSLSLKAPMRRGSPCAATSKLCLLTSPQDAEEGVQRSRDLDVHCTKSLFLDINCLDVMENSPHQRSESSMPSSTICREAGQKRFRHTLKKQQSAPHLPQRRESVPHYSTYTEEPSTSQAPPGGKQKRKSKIFKRQLSVPTITKGNCGPLSTHQDARRRSLPQKLIKTDPSQQQKIATNALAAEDELYIRDSRQLMEGTTVGCKEKEPSKIHESLTARLPRKSIGKARLGATPTELPSQELALETTSGTTIQSEARSIGRDPLTLPSQAEAGDKLKASSISAFHSPECHSSADRQRDEPTKQEGEVDREIQWAPSRRSSLDKAHTFPHVNKAVEKTLDIEWTPEQREKRKVSSSTGKLTLKTIRKIDGLAELPYLSASASQLRHSPKEVQCKMRKHKSVSSSLGEPGGDMQRRRSSRVLKKQHSVPAKLAHHSEGEAAIDCATLRKVGNTAGKTQSRPGFRPRQTAKRASCREENNGAIDSTGPDLGVFSCKPTASDVIARSPVTESPMPSRMNSCMRLYASTSQLETFYDGLANGHSNSSAALKFSPNDGQEVDPYPPKITNRRKSMNRSFSAPGLTCEQEDIGQPAFKQDTFVPGKNRRQTICPAEIPPLFRNVAALNALKIQRRERHSLCSPALNRTKRDEKSKIKTRIKVTARISDPLGGEVSSEMRQNILENMTAVRLKNRVPDKGLRDRRCRAASTTSMGRHTSKSGQSLHAPNSANSKSYPISVDTKMTRRMRQGSSTTSTSQSLCYTPPRQTRRKAAEKDNVSSRLSTPKSRTSNPKQNLDRLRMGVPIQGESYPKVVYRFFSDPIHPYLTLPYSTQEDAEDAPKASFSGSQNKEIVSCPLTDRTEKMYSDRTSVGVGVLERPHESSTNLGSTSDSLSTPISFSPAAGESSKLPKPSRPFLKELLLPSPDDHRLPPERTVSEITEDPMFRKVALAGITDEQLSRLQKLGLKIIEA